MWDLLDTAGQEVKNLKCKIMITGILCDERAVLQKFQFSYDCVLNQQHVCDFLHFLAIFRTSFESVEQYYNEVQRNLDDAYPACVLVGNKCDLEQDRVVLYEDVCLFEMLSYFQALELANRLGIPYVETSAKNGTNVGVAFVSALRMYYRKIALNKYLAQQKKEKLRDFGEFKCVLTGDGGVGKSALTVSFVTGSVSVDDAMVAKWSREDEIYVQNYNKIQPYKRAMPKDLNELPRSDVARNDMMSLVHKLQADSTVTLNYVENSQSNDIESALKSRVMSSSSSVNTTQSNSGAKSFVSASYSDSDGACVVIETVPQEYDVKSKPSSFYSVVIDHKMFVIPQIKTKTLSMRYRQKQLKDDQKNVYHYLKSMTIAVIANNQVLYIDGDGNINDFNGNSFCKTPVPFRFEYNDLVTVNINEKQGILQCEICSFQEHLSQM